MGECAQEFGCVGSTVEPEPILVDALKLILRTLARGLVSAYVGWEIVPDNDGYIRRRNAGVTVMLPFHLLSDFPVEDDLSALVNLSNLVRAGSTSIICLSGSSTFLGTLHVVADLDFCEYIADDERSVVDHIAAIARRADDSAVCLGLRLGRDEWRRPWPLGGPPNALELIAKLHALPIKGRHGKLDVVLVDPSGVGIEASNVLIWLEKGVQESGASDRSFAFQEAPFSLSEMSWLPRRLARPETIGKYVMFLRKQIDCYRGKRPAKAAKKALSLAVFLLFSSHADELRGLLARHEAVQDVANQREELLSKLKSQNDAEIESILVAVQRGLESIESISNAEELSAEGFTEQADHIISRLVTEVDLLLQPSGSREKRR